VSETRATTTAFPPGRYGRRRDGRRRPAVISMIVLAAVIAASGLLSVRLYQRYGQTDYRPQIVGWDRPTAHLITIKFAVRVPAGGSAGCGLRARDYNGNEVGRRDVVVRAAPGASRIEAAEPVTTTARASVGEVLGCQPAG
jgi:uncharacterized protein DUF4307